MKKSFLILALAFVSTIIFAQTESFDLLKYKVPSGWTSQSRPTQVSYVGTEPETNTPVEIIVYKSQDGAPKIDSSFRQEWHRIFDASYGSPSIPAVRKRNSANSLQYAENGAELMHGGQKQYSHLFVFSANGKIQTIQINASKLVAYKALRLFVDELLESVDTLVKRAE